MMFLSKTGTGCLSVDPKKKKKKKGPRPPSQRMIWPATPSLGLSQTGGNTLIAIGSRQSPMSIRVWVLGNL
jgi:hypothetical protein